MKCEIVLSGVAETNLETSPFHLAMIVLMLGDSERNLARARFTLSGGWPAQYIGHSSGRTCRWEGSVKRTSPINLDDINKSIVAVIYPNLQTSPDQLKLTDTSILIIFCRDYYQNRHSTCR